MFEDRNEEHDGEEGDAPQLALMKGLTCEFDAAAQTEEATVNEELKKLAINAVSNVECIIGVSHDHGENSHGVGDKA